LKCRARERREFGEAIAICTPTSGTPDLEFDLVVCHREAANPSPTTRPEIDAARVAPADFRAIFQGHPVYRGLYEAPITRALAAWVAMGNP